MIITRIASLLILLSALPLVSCGGDDDTPPTEQVFVLSEVAAEDLRNIGMGIEMTGDTAGMYSTEGERVFSPDSSKVAYCDHLQLIVEDADGSTRRVIHEMTDEKDVRACYSVRWGSDGRELAFTQARESGATSLQLMTVTITLGSDSQGE